MDSHRHKREPICKLSVAVYVLVFEQATHHCNGSEGRDAAALPVYLCVNFCFARKLERAHSHQFLITTVNTLAVSSVFRLFFLRLAANLHLLWAVGADVKLQKQQEISDANKYGRRQRAAALAEICCNMPSVCARTTIGFHRRVSGPGCHHRRRRCRRLREPQRLCRFYITIFCLMEKFATLPRSPPRPILALTLRAVPFCSNNKTISVTYVKYRQ